VAAARSGEIMLSVAKTSRADTRSAPVSRRSATATAKPVGAAPPTSLQQARFGVLQRKCACGGTCPRCRGETHIQPKLAINEPGDTYEQEADRIADRVMRMADPRLRASPALPGVQRKCAACEEEEKKSKLQTKRDPSDAGAATATAPPIVPEVLRSPGQPLDAETRAFMEPRFGQDFSRVRVHVDAKAAESARQVNALAYTVGDNVVFGGGQFAPASAAGQGLLAHELTHVVQQSGTFRPACVQRQVGSPASPAADVLSEEMLRQIARELQKAMAGLDTDEDSIYSALSGRTQDQVDEIARVYQDMYKRDLQADLQHELSGSELKHLATLSPTTASRSGAAAATAGRADMVAAQLNEAMSGPGTDETSIYSALTGRTVAERQAIKDAYKRRTGRELETDLRDELSGSDLTHALVLLNQGVRRPEDELYLAMAGLGTDEATIFRVLSELSGNAAALHDLEKNYKLKYGDLVQDLRDELSSSDYERARQYFRPTLKDADVQDCDPSKNPLQTPESVRDAHARASELLTNARSKSADSTDVTVQWAAQIFNITLPTKGPEQTLLWARVRHVLDTMASADSEATYECEPEQNIWNGLCLAGTDAVSLGNIHLCPNFWTAHKTIDDRAYVLVHEWAHKFGAGVARIFETYCWEAEYAKLSADTLVRTPDAYASFVLQLGTDRVKPCV